MFPASARPLTPYPVGICITHVLSPLHLCKICAYCIYVLNEIILCRDFTYVMSRTKNLESFVGQLSSSTCYQDFLLVIFLKLSY